MAVGGAFPTAERAADPRESRLSCRLLTLWLVLLPMSLTENSDLHCIQGSGFCILKERYAIINEFRDPETD